MSFLDFFHLVDNPFGLVPSSDNIIWADQEEFKRDLINSLKFSLQTSPSRIVASIVGEWGTGKTHALTYFKQTHVLRSVVKECNLDPDKIPLVVRVLYPGSNIIKTIYYQIIENIGIERIREAVNMVAKDVDTLSHMGALAEKLRDFTENEYLSRALVQVDRNRLQVERYLSSKASASELKTLDVPRGIENNNDRVDTLSSLFKLLTSTVTSRILLWFDDVERLGDGSGKDMYQFRYFIRDLLDGIPSNMMILMNFTYKPGDEVVERLELLGDALLRRITYMLQIAELNKQRYMTYVGDMLRAFRPEGFDPNSYEPFHPFETNAIEYVFENIFVIRKKRVTPSSVNKALANALDLFAGQLELGSADTTISRDFFVEEEERIFIDLERE